MSDLAVFALSRKRAELAGEIIAREAVLDQLRVDLAHLDAAIRIMCPDAEPELIRPKKPSRKGCDWFGRGELARAVLDVLRGTDLRSCPILERGRRRVPRELVGNFGPGKRVYSLARRSRTRTGRGGVAQRWRRP